MAVLPAYEPRSQLWRWREHWSGEVGTYRMGRFSARVQDCDGDFSVFEVKVGDTVVAESQFSGPFHWPHAIFAAEEKLTELGALAPATEARP